MRDLLAILTILTVVLTGAYFTGKYFPYNNITTPRSTEASGSYVHHREKTKQHSSDDFGKFLYDRVINDRAIGFP